MVACVVTMQAPVLPIYSNVPENMVHHPVTLPNPLPASQMVNKLLISYYNIIILARMIKECIQAGDAEHKRDSRLCPKSGSSKAVPGVLHDYNLNHHYHHHFYY